MIMRNYLSARQKMWIGLGLSIVPGLGHVLYKKWVKSLSMLLIDAALITGVVLTESRGIYALMVVVYIIILFSCMSEIKCYAGFGKENSFRDSKGYIAFLLLTVGINALPLLWQSKSYNRTGKVLWTIALPFLAIGFFGSVYLIAN